MTGNMIREDNVDRVFIVKYRRTQGEGEIKAVAIARSHDDAVERLRRLYPRVQVTELTETEYTPIIGIRTIDAILESQAYAYLNKMTGRQLMQIPREDTNEHQVPQKKLERVLG